MLKLNKTINKATSYASASLVVGLMSASEANAAAANTASFSTISQTITSQIGGLPGFITALSYIMGTLFAVLGILKIKDHVENPSNTPLKDGAIRLAVGGGLFTVPLITAAMQNLVGTGTGTQTQALQNVNTYNTLAP